MRHSLRLGVVDFNDSYPLGTSTNGLVQAIENKNSSDIDSSLFYQIKR